MVFPVVVQRWKLRLWIVAVTLIAGGFILKLVMAREDVAISYPFSVAIQSWCYLLGLFFWFLWTLAQTRAESGMRIFGCASFSLLDLFCFFAVISSVPK